LRAVAILCVLFAHSYYSWGAQLHVGPFLMKVWDSLGGYGVGLFFALSGFLITRLLVVERERTGSVDLRNFYVRRTLRIIPAFVLYVSVLWFLQSRNVTNVDRTSMLAGTFFVKNYVMSGAGDWPVVHLWSLSIEEQFYLIWPAVIAFLGIAKARRIALALVLAMPFWRTVHYAIFPASRALISVMFHTTPDRFAYGALLALYFDDSRVRTFFGRRQTGWAVLAGVVFLFTVSPFLDEKLRGAYRFPVGITVAAVVHAGILGWALWGRRTVAHRVLEAKSLKGIATISYSLYLWQELFLSNHPGTPLKPYERLPVNLVLAFLCATASYVLVERYFLRLRLRFGSTEAPAPRPAVLPNG